MSLQDELKQLPYLEKVIKLEIDRLQRLRDSIGIQSPSLSGMPKGGASRDKIGETVPTICDEEAAMLESIRQYSEQRERLLRFINGTREPKMRLILIMRYIEQKSWAAIADAIDNGDGKEKDYTVKQACFRYLDAQERRQRKKAAPGLMGG